MSGKLILIDNYDSFTYNVVQYLKELGVEPKVFKNDEITIDELKQMDFSSIVISPGPKGPSGAGICLDIIAEFYKTKKILGICLGHQCIAQYFGGNVVKAKEPMHGKVSKIYFTPDPLFEGLEQGFEATRYHSLVVENESLPDCIVPLAYAYEAKSKKQKVKSNEKTFCLLPFTFCTLMALKHKDYPIYGVQFHPEAILTQGGKKLIENFLKI